MQNTEPLDAAPEFHKMLFAPYEDVRAVLSYGGRVIMPRGCKSIAISHRMNDSGQFQPDFNDARYLPFEGIPVDDIGPHIRYTIQP